MLKSFLILSLVFGAASAFADPQLVQQLSEPRLNEVLPLKTLKSIAAKISLKTHNVNQDARVYRGQTSMDAHKISLYQPDFYNGTTLLPALSLMIQSADQYYTALFEYYLYKNIENGPETEYKKFFVSRAQKVMTGAPVQYRVEAYRNAIASFFGNIFAIASNVEVIYQKKGKEKLCRSIDLDAKTIFYLWDIDFADSNSFFGYYFLWDGTPGFSKGKWVEVQNFVQEIDRKTAVQAILEGFWKGNRRDDFKNKYCTP